MLFNSSGRRGPPHAPPPCLLVRHSLQHNLPKGKYIALPHSGRLVIGRGDDSDLRLEWDGASRTHAVVTWSTASAAGKRQLCIAAVKPCPNGIFVNGERVDFAALEQGDMIAIGCGARRDHLPQHDAFYVFQVVEQQQQQQQQRVSSSLSLSNYSQSHPSQSSSRATSAPVLASQHSHRRYGITSSKSGQQQQQQQQQQHNIMRLDSSSSNGSEQGKGLVGAKFARAARRLGGEVFRVGGESARQHQHGHDQQQQQQQQQQLTAGAIAAHEMQDDKRQREHLRSMQQLHHQASVQQQQQVQQLQQNQQQRQMMLREEQRERMQRGEYGSKAGGAAGNEGGAVAMQGTCGQPVGFGRRHVLGLEVDQQKKAMEQERVAGVLRLQIMDQKRQQDAERMRVKLAATMEAEGRREAALQLQKLKAEKVEQLRFMGVGTKHVQQLQDWQPRL